MTMTKYEQSNAKYLVGPASSSKAAQIVQSFTEHNLLIIPIHQDPNISTGTIHAKFIGPTTHKPARIKAYVKTRANDPALSITLSYDHALTDKENHRMALDQLLIKLKWSGVYVQGSLPNGDSIFVKIPNT